MMNQPKFRTQAEINTEYTNVCTQLGDIQCKRRRMIMQEVELEKHAEALLVEKSIESVEMRSPVSLEDVQDPVESGV